MVVAYGGHPGEIAALRALADARGLTLLEDAAHAIGARHAGRHLGTFGAAGAFSFFSNKNLAVGEGGAVVTDDDALAERMRLLRSHGMTTLTWDRHRGHAAGYDVVALGFNYRIDEPRAALAHRPPGAARRRERAPPRARPPATASGSPSVDGIAAHGRARAPHLHRGRRRGDRPRRASARRSPSAASRRACTTRRSTASRSTPTARRSSRSPTPTAPAPSRCRCSPA